MTQSAREPISFMTVVDEEASIPLGINKSREMAGHGDTNKMEFTFDHRGFLFAVRATSHDQSTKMQFRAHLGNLPYTHEDPFARVNAFAVVEAAGETLGGKISLTSEQHIMFSESIEIDEPLTPALLVTKAAGLLLKADPYLELLSMIITPPSNPNHH